MRYAYSPSANLFYAIEWKNDYGDSWPLDCKEVETDQFDKFSADAPVGKIRVAGSNGMPSWDNIPPPSEKEKKDVAEGQKNRLRSIADAEIAWRQDAEDAGIATPEESAALAEWKKFRVLLMRVDTSEPIWPEAPAS